MRCYLQLKLFGKRQTVDLLLDVSHSIDVTGHSEQLKKSWWIFCRFCSCCVFFSGSGIGVPRPWRVVHSCQQNTWRGICQHVEKSWPSSCELSEFSHSYLVTHASSFFISLNLYSGNCWFQVINLGVASFAADQFQLRLFWPRRAGWPCQLCSVLFICFLIFEN